MKKNIVNNSKETDGQRPANNKCVNCSLCNKCANYSLCNKYTNYSLCNKCANYSLCNKYTNYSFCNKCANYSLCGSTWLLYHYLYNRSFHWVVLSLSVYAKEVFTWLFYHHQFMQKRFSLGSFITISLCKRSFYLVVLSLFIQNKI